MKTQELVQQLKSRNSAKVYNALVEIRKNYVRKFDRMQELEKHHAIQEIIALIEHPKFCNISLSIIADACLNKVWVTKIIENNGLKSLSRIMKSLINDDVQNRACRALGNIAKLGFSKEIHTVDLITSILKFLSEAEKITCKQTAIRTLRILGETSKSRDIIIRGNGVFFIARLLRSSDKDLIMCSTQALAVLTENCNEDCVIQLWEADSLKTFIGVYSQNETDIKTNVMKILQNLSCHPFAHASLIKAGVIKLFSEAANNLLSFEIRKMAILGLCSCSRYLLIINHGTVEQNGLKPLIKALQLEEFQNIHSNIVFSLLPLSFERGTVEVLIDFEIITILIENLKMFIQKYGTEHEKYVSYSNSFDSDAEFSSPKKRTKVDAYLDFNSNDMYLSGDVSKIVEESSKKENSVAKSTKNVNSFYPISVINTYPVGNNFTNYLQSSEYFSFHSSGCNSLYSPSSSCSNIAVSPKIVSDYTLGWPKSFSSSYPVWSPSDESEESLCFSPVESICDNGDSQVLDETNDIASSAEYNVLDCENLKSDSQSTSALPILEVKGKHSFSKLFQPDYSTRAKGCSYLNCDADSDKESERSFLQNRNISFSCKESDMRNYEKVELMAEPDSNRIYSENVNKKFKSSDQSCENPQKVECISSYSSLNKNEEQQRIDINILSLLSRLSFHVEKKCNSDFASTSFFSVILQYICCVQDADPNAEKILLKLVQNRYCFEKLIMNGFVSKIEKILEIIHNPDVCNHCSHVLSVHQNLIAILQKEAETDYSIGTLGHILCTSGKMCQFNAIYAISKLVLTKSALWTLLIQASGLKIIFEFVSSASEAISKQAVICLCQIYQNLNKISNAEFLKKCCISQTCKLQLTSKCIYKDEKPDLTFIVEGGVQIGACRNKICSNSDYFCALLKGNFKESTNSIVSINGISAETLTTIFHFLHGCYSTKYCPYIKRIPFEVLLQLIIQCDKFLLHDIKTFVEDRLCHSFFPETIPKIYHTAKIYHSDTLYKKAVHYALCLDVSKKEPLLKCFQELLKFETTFCILTDIQNLIEDFMKDCN